MAKICLPKGSGKWLKVREKSGNFEMDIEWQPCSCLPKRPRPTVKTQIRLLLKKQSDQGLPCLLF